MLSIWDGRLGVDLRPWKGRLDTAGHKDRRTTLLADVVNVGCRTCKSKASISPLSIRASQLQDLLDGVLYFNQWRFPMQNEAYVPVMQQVKTAGGRSLRAGTECRADTRLSPWAPRYWIAVGECRNYTIIGSFIERLAVLVIPSHLCTSLPRSS